MPLLYYYYYYSLSSSLFYFFPLGQVVSPHCFPSSDISFLPSFLLCLLHSFFFLTII
ncbi:hypothetical protein F4809DRAFT_598234 [Biscogniauxia mediterranea]|nr:hypothetical protein F4809DRAFT_598234 [Biscogniauxia mediterranea]